MPPVDDLFQSIQSSRGGMESHFHLLLGARISIPPIPRGVGLGFADAMLTRGISIRPLAGWALRRPFTPGTVCNFNPPTPSRGRTIWTIHTSSCGINFNPPTPRGVGQQKCPTGSLSLWSLLLKRTHTTVHRLPLWADQADKARHISAPSGANLQAVSCILQVRTGLQNQLTLHIMDSLSADVGSPLDYCHLKDKSEGCRDWRQ